MSPDLALFDFDGTISRRDSFLLFIRKNVGQLRFWSGMALLGPRIGLFLLGRYPNQALKEDVLTRFLRGWDLERLRAAAELFARETVPGILRPLALERLEWHQGRGDRIIVVTATPEPILAPWCAARGLEILGTELETENGRLTGRIRGENCRGMAKVERIRRHCDPSRYAEIFAYGDTRGDHPMLAMADHPFYRPFTEHRG